MARQAINLGALPNGVGGDTPRSANTKINDMTQELYDALGATTGGSNANGTFIRFADGTMICHAALVSIQATANVRKDTNLSFPAAFLATPTLVPTLQYPTVVDNNNVAVKRFTGTATGPSAALIQLTTAENNTYMVGYIAAGRWK